MGFKAAPVTAGTLIDSSGTWADSTFSLTSIGNADFSGYSFNQHALVAYRFKTTANASTYLYGWAEMSAGIQTGTAYVGLYGYAYESSGAGITARATAIPEPGVSAVIFGLAALAFIGVRRMRQRTVTAWSPGAHDFLKHRF